jgi:hypothetical protein
MNQPATTPDPVRFPILTRHWNFTPIGESADLAIDIIGQRCIARAESEDDFEAATKFRNTLDQMRGDEKGAAA